MALQLELKLTPEQAASAVEIKKAAANAAQIPVEQIALVKIIRKSLDARKAQIVFFVEG